MSVQVKFNLISFGIVTGMFVGMMALLELGRYLGTRTERKPGDPGTSATSAAIFALLGLLLALMFSSAGQRFEERRHLIVEETNAIGTAYKRIDLMPPDAQPRLRDSFRRYVDSRIDVYHKFDEEPGTESREAAVTKLQNEIWDQVVAAVGRDGVPTSTPILMMPALNAMLDITTTRSAATLMHTPGLIFAFLIGLALCGSMLAGYGAAHAPRDWVHNLAFAASIAVTLYVIIDLEYPRLGLIRVNAFDQLLVSLRASMG